MADAPSFDCSSNVTAAPSADGATYKFDASSLVADGALPVTIVPTTSTGRVALAAPDVNSPVVTATTASGEGSASSAAGSEGGAE